MIRLRFDLAYDGTDFSGWAAQPGLRTVQGELEEALAVLLRQAAPARLTVAGRTDAGVHARGQVAHLDVEGDLAERLSARRVNGVLRRQESADIVVHDVSRAPEGFDARFSALSRRYEYRLRDGAVRRDPLTARFTAEVTTPLDLSAMRLASERLLGLRDFASFCKAREGSTTIRDLRQFEWRIAEDGAFAATVEADAFCHSMVRALVGSVVAVGSGRIDEAELEELRDARERTSRFTVMPAHGLSLEEIRYPDGDALAARAVETRARREEII